MTNQEMFDRMKQVQKDWKKIKSSQNPLTRGDLLSIIFIQEIKGIKEAISSKAKDEKN